MSNFEKILKTVKTTSFLLVLFDIIFITVPGATVIFLYNKNLFIDLELFKLLILSASVTTPLIFLFSIFSGIRYEHAVRQSENDFFYDFSFSSIIVGLMVYASLLVNYLLFYFYKIKIDFSIKNFIFIILLFTILTVIINVWEIIEEYYKTKK